MSPELIGIWEIQLSHDTTSTEQVTEQAYFSSTIPICSTINYPQITE